MITTVTREQFFTAVASVSQMDTLYQAIPLDAESSVNIEFNAAKYIEVGDPLYVATQLALGYTSAQMTALFETAVQVPV